MPENGSIITKMVVMMESYKYSGQVINYGGASYFFNALNTAIWPVSRQVGEFLAMCQGMSFAKMLAEGHYSRQELRSLCLEVSPLLKERQIAWTEPEDVNGLLIDFNNINFVWDLSVKTNTSVQMEADELALRARCKEVAHFLLQYSHKARFYHLALTGSATSALEKLAALLAEEIAQTGKKVVFSIAVAGDAPAPEYEQSHFYLATDVCHTYSAEERAFQYLEEYLAYWRYGLTEPPVCPGQLPGELENELGEYHQIFIQTLATAPVKYREIGKFFKQLKNRQKRYFNCPGGINSLVLDLTSGGFTACPRLNDVVGNLQDGLDYRSKQRYLQTSVLSREECRKCWARYLCGGYCHVTGSRDCTEWQQVLKLLVGLYAQTNKLFEELAVLLDNEIEFTRQQCFLSPISENCILEKKA